MGGGIEVVAEGKADWIGWAELKTAPVDEIAVHNTGRVIRDVDADILAVVEAENRVLLKTFGHYVTQVAPYPGKQYPPDPKAAQNLL